MNESTWGSVTDAALYMGVSPRTIRRMISRGEIVAKRFGPRLIRVDMARLAESGRPLAWTAA